MHVKKGDMVLVLAGNDKGKTGEVKEALPREGRVVVEGVNLRWRHQRPSQQNPKGERVQREISIHASNVRRVEPAAAPKRKGAKAAKAPRKPARGAGKQG
jgi:large subunit ribosomal protein L24